MKIFQIQNKSIELSLLFSIPACAGLVLASEEIINSLFGYGSFSEENIVMTSKALKYFGYGVPAFALIKVLSNFFFARNNTKTPFYLSLFIVLLNVIISLSYFKELGFIIIPIATSLSTWIGVIAYLIILNKRNFLNFSSFISKIIFKIIFATLLMSFVLYFGLDLFHNNLIYAYKFKSLYLLFIVSFVATIYLITCYLLGVLKIKNYKIN